MIQGMIIKESLVDLHMLSNPMLNIVERYPMRMDGKYPIEIVMVEVAEEHLLAALLLVSQNLRPKRFYAHLVAGDVMYVVYPWTVSVVNRGDEESAARCIETGASFNVPTAQLPINKMFAFGHAEHPEQA